MDGDYLSLRSIQHQIIQLAENALLQLLPGDVPVLVHQKGRPKPGGVGGVERTREEMMSPDLFLVAFDQKKSPRRFEKLAYVSHTHTGTHAAHLTAC